MEAESNGTEMCQASQMCAVCPVSNAMQSCGIKVQCDPLNHVTDIPGSTTLKKTKKAITMTTFHFMAFVNTGDILSTIMQVINVCMHFTAVRKH